MAPTWIKALEWLAPLLLAGAAVLLMPERNRRDILVTTLAFVVTLLLVEALMLLTLHIRIDLGRSILVFSGVSLLSVWLVGDDRKELVAAFKRGSDFLAAGRLEPAFAELRRCPPSDTLASVMYKLSLAFEQQAKAERAEAVLESIKRAQSGCPNQRLNRCRSTAYLSGSAGMSSKSASARARWAPCIWRGILASTARWH